MLTVGIIGAGAIGGWLAARLKLAGHDVTLLRAPERLDSDRRLLEYREGEEIHELDFPAASALVHGDLLVIAVKAVHLADAARLAAQTIGPDTIVLPLQNGVPWWFMAPERLDSVDPDGSIAASIPQANLVGGVVHAAVRREGRRITLVKADRLLLGEPGSASRTRVSKLVATLIAAGIPAEADPDIRRSIWYKLWGNLTMNPISALTGATLLDMVESVELRPFILSCMAECAELGRAIGCPIDQSGEDRMEVARTLGAFKTSMLQDVEAGRPIELEALVGATREIAGLKGVPVPGIDALYGLTRLMALKKGLL